MVDYLDRVGEAGVPRERLVLAALGPKALRLSADKTLGAHPYLTSPVHDRAARAILGETALLAPGQKLILDTDPDRARGQARENVARYLRLVNYRNNLLREGWTESDLENEGSDRLIDSLVLHGSVDRIADGLRAHVSAGASHVCVEVLGDARLEGYGQLAEALLG
jgi:probable F420-dependent oxidoreductase